MELFRGARPVSMLHTTRSVKTRLPRDTSNSRQRNERHLREAGVEGLGKRLQPLHRDRSQPAQAEPVRRSYRQPRGSRAPAQVDLMGAASACQDNCTSAACQTYAYRGIRLSQADSILSLPHFLTAFLVSPRPR